jgi:hypothetical protein
LSKAILRGDPVRPHVCRDASLLGTILTASLLPIGCEGTSGRHGPWQGPDNSGTSRPVVAHSRFIDPGTGKVIRELDPPISDMPAIQVEGSTGIFRLGDLLVDATSQSIVGSAKPEIDFDDNNHRKVIRQDNKGQRLWTVVLDDVAGRDWAIHNDRVFVACGNGLVALGGKTGEILWKSEGPNQSLTAWDDFILSLACYKDDSGPKRLLVARRMIDGQEVFRTQFPKDAETERILIMEGVFIVGAHFNDGPSFLLDHTGRILFRLNEAALSLKKCQDNLIVLSGTSISRLSSEGNARWKTALPRQVWDNHGSLFTLSGGDLLAFTYCTIADSGIQAMRICPETGKAVWSAYCAPLMVDHSEYYHDAYVEIRGKELIVVSQGSYGDFIEVLDVESGKRLNRWVFRKVFR